jgi:hypothetical protein
MRTCLPLSLSIAVLLGLPACKKEMISGDTTLLSDTVSATNATTLSFSGDWGGSVMIGEADASWSLADTLGGLRIPFALQPGDRLVATLQVGLSQVGGTSPCLDSLHVTIGSVLGGSFAITPVSAGVVAFDGAFSVDSLWPQQVWVKQFTRQQELEVTTAVPAGVVQTFVKLRSLNDDCTLDADTVHCPITNRSLTLTVIHP